MIMENLQVIHPGNILLEEFLSPLGISRYRLAKETFMDITRISEIVKGERGITADAALRFSKFFGNSPDFWMNLQNKYELGLKKQELADELVQIKRYVNKMVSSPPIVSQAAAYSHACQELVTE